jgi:hypothetical protein
MHPLSFRSAVVFFASLAVGAMAAGSTACSRPAEGSSAPPASASGNAGTPGAMASSAPPSSAANGTLALGERITSPLVSLADIAKDPGRYKDRVFATSGKVTAVCQEMGCWMQLEDATGQAHVRMHGHHFFVPRTSPGHFARVQATIVKSPGGGDDCEDGKSAKIELDATGVEID